MKTGGRIKHGMYRTLTYATWQDMKKRCKPHNGGYLRPKNKHYRGVIYCPHWEKFECFLSDMGVKPEGYFLDRIDNSKGYYKDNCRWVTPSQSAANVVKKRKHNLPRGVNYCGNKYRATITIKYKSYYLGLYPTIEKASEVYNTKYKEIYGELPNKSRGEELCT